MRLWSLHPRYLDARGLVALWREALLAQAVLHGRTRGYRRHPQLDRFRDHAAPHDAIGCFLDGVHEEATARGYSFDSARIIPHAREVAPIAVTDGQSHHEWGHLLTKLATRDPQRHRDLTDGNGVPDLHPLFVPTPGPIAPWERAP